MKSVLTELNDVLQEFLVAIKKRSPKDKIEFVAMPDEAWNRLNVCSEKGHDLDDNGHCKRCDI